MRVCKRGFRDSFPEVTFNQEKLVYMKEKSVLLLIKSECANLQSEMYTAPHEKKCIPKHKQLKSTALQYVSLLFKTDASQNQVIALYFKSTLLTKKE